MITVKNRYSRIVTFLQNILNNIFVKKLILVFCIKNKKTGTALIKQVEPTQLIRATMFRQN